MGEAEVDFQELRWDLRMALADFLAVFLDRPGWYYPILTRVGGATNPNFSLADALVWKEDFTMKVLELDGLVMFRHPHGWQIRSDEF
jgi:hypothetical protein